MNPSLKYTKSNPPTNTSVPRLYDYIFSYNFPSKSTISNMSFNILNFISLSSGVFAVNEGEAFTSYYVISIILKSKVLNHYLSAHQSHITQNNENLSS